MGQSFPKTSRLLKRTEFKFVLSSSVKAVDRLIVVLAQPSKQPQTRMGLIVSKKVGNAVVRNATKRRLREAFRRKKDNFREFDVVVIARHTAAGSSQAQIANSLERCLSKIERKIHVQSPTA